MSLTNTDIDNLIKSLSQEEKEILFQRLKESQSDSSAKHNHSDKVYCCIYCGSTNYKKHGITNKGLQRYICKDCKRTFSENYGDSLRYTHISESEWKSILYGFVTEQSIPQIAKDLGYSTKTIWLAKTKVNKALMIMYGYEDLFRGTTQADEFYTRAAFKGKRDPEFFIYTLRRMPRHNRNRQEKIEWLEKAGLYSTLLSEEPDFLEELLSENPKKKRGISNEQICILTLVDDTGKLYLEPVSVGRLEKSMAKQKLRSKFTNDKNTVLVTDEHNAYKRILYGTGATHEIVKADKHSNGKYNLAKVNSIHSALSGFMSPQKGRVFNTKYLDLTLMLFWWLQSNKDKTTDEKVKILFDIMTDKIPDRETREKVNQEKEVDLRNREITLDTKGCFPTKL